VRFVERGAVFHDLPDLLSQAYSLLGQCCRSSSDQGDARSKPSQRRPCESEVFSGEVALDYGSSTAQPMGTGEESSCCESVTLLRSYGLPSSSISLSSTASTTVPDQIAAPPGTLERQISPDEKQQRWRERRERKKAERKARSVSGTYGEVLRTHGWMLKWRLSNQMLCELESLLVDRGINISKMEPLGSGRFARVFRACWKRSEAEPAEDVAVKLMRVEMPQPAVEEGTFSQTASKWLRREVEANATCRHPNLVQMHHSLLEQQPHVIILELCAGGTLEDLLHGPPATPSSVAVKEAPEVDLEPPSHCGCWPRWKQRFKIAWDIAQGMAHLHGMGLMHRDLKPANVLLKDKLVSPNQAPLAKVADLGLARFLHDKEKSSRAMPMMMSVDVGSCAYMAPEVHRRLLTPVDEDKTLLGCYSQKVDVFSYAIVLYELLSLEFPFHDTLADIGPLVCSGVRPRESSIPSDAPALLCCIMRACWSGQPSLRPSFKDVAFELSKGYVGILLNASPTCDVKELSAGPSASAFASLPSIPEHRRACTE